MQQWFFIVVLVFVLVGCEAIPDQQEQVLPTVTPIPTAQAAARTTYSVQRGDVRETFIFRGRWLPRDQQQLSFEVQGTVRNVTVRSGDTIEAGAVLADLQIDELEDQLIRNQLALDAARRRLDEGGDNSSNAVVDAQFNLANQNLTLDGQRATLPWSSVQNAADAVVAAERQVENAERSYDDTVSRPDSPASSVDNAYEQLLSAQENLAQRRRSYSDAVASYYNSALSVDRQENSVLQAEINLERAQDGGGDPDLVDAVIESQIALDRTIEQISQSTLIAPFAGVVIEVTIQAGDTVQAFTTVITIALPEPLEGIANLSFNDIQLLQIGQVGICRDANNPDLEVQCIIRNLPLSNRDVDQTVRVAATLPELQQGALVEAEMTLRESLNTLWLPPQAVNEFGNRTFVVVQTDDGERVRDVEIGLQTDDRVEIESGLEEGDIIVQQ
ncbi:MAG: HlyD family efflux transporter periplasmic adaptor subunit [Anaerolineae bacterium]|nr:HlyD family efflux transporter periplasmic adaptor subunit [Anaerolineae bacterium]